MEINNNQFDNLIKNIPSIQVSLTWIYNEGDGNFQKELEVGEFVIETNFSCYETGTSDSGSHETEPSFISSGLDVFDIEANIFNQDADEIKLSTEQKEKLYNTIKSSVTSI